MQPTIDILEKAKNVELLIFDVDGVFTNGQIWLSGDGDEVKVFHCHDGFGVKKLRHESNIIIAVISGRSSPSVKLRMQELGIEHVHLGIKDKVPVFEKLLQDTGVSAANCAYVGDDEPDVPVMEKVGFKIAVANATPVAKKIADWQTSMEGGHGAVREVCDLILQAKRL